MSNLDRSEINRALAKAIAYKQCGKDVEASAWAAHLVALLEWESILSDDGQAMARAMAVVEG